MFENLDHTKSNFFESIKPVNWSSHDSCWLYIYEWMKFLLKDYDNKIWRTSNNWYNEFLASFVLENNLYHINQEYSNENIVVDSLTPIYWTVDIGSWTSRIIYPFVEDINVGNIQNNIYMKSRKDIEDILYKAGCYLDSKKIVDINAINTDIREVDNIIRLRMFDLISSLKTEEFHDYVVLKSHNK